MQSKGRPRAVWRRPSGEPRDEISLEGDPTLNQMWDGDDGDDASKLLDAFVEERGDTKAVDTLRRRLQYWGIPSGAVEVAVWERRFGEGTPRVVPLQHCFVVVRVVCRAVCPSHRFRDLDVGCFLVCRQAGSDDIRHYLTCPVARLTAACFNHRDDRWAAHGSMRQGLFH